MVMAQPLLGSRRNPSPEIRHARLRRPRLWHRPGCRHLHRLHL